jgi:hypothetical protein
MCIYMYTTKIKCEVLIGFLDIGNEGGKKGLGARGARGAREPGHGDKQGD